jgi:hypothetical protein
LPFLIENIEHGPVKLRVTMIQLQTKIVEAALRNFARERKLCSESPSKHLLHCYYYGVQRTILIGGISAFNRFLRKENVQSPPSSINAKKEKR